MLVFAASNTILMKFPHYEELYKIQETTEISLGLIYVKGRPRKHWAGGPEEVLAVLVLVSLFLLCLG